MKQQINSVFEQIRLPAQASERIRAQLDMECSNLTEKGLDNMQAKKNIRVRKKVLAGVIAAAVICAVPAGVYAANNIISFIAGSGQISDGGAAVTFDTGSLDSYLKVVDGKLILDQTAKNWILRMNFRKRNHISIPPSRVTVRPIT